MWSVKHVETKRLRTQTFVPVLRSKRSQAATMTIRPGGESSEDSSNEHAWAEQWMYVVSGRGIARIGRRSVPLKEGTVVLIQRRDPHVIKNTGRKNLVTFNVYVPPAYDDEGEPLK